MVSSPVSIRIHFSPPRVRKRHSSITPPAVIQPAKRFRETSGGGSGQGRLSMAMSGQSELLSSKPESSMPGADEAVSTRAALVHEGTAWPVPHPQVDCMGALVGSACAPPCRHSWCCSLPPPCAATANLLCKSLCCANPQPQPSTITITSRPVPEQCVHMPIRMPISPAAVGAALSI